MLFRSGGIVADAGTTLAAAEAAPLLHAHL